LQIDIASPPPNWTVSATARDLKFETSKFVHLAKIFQKNVVITSDLGRPQGGGNGHFPPWDWN